ncbi:zinc finger, CCCH type domain-containing protein [Cryptosporidium muris RN66]|uniref:Zinc finger, CCCH type domain-containing protein n=1 Tax=Cryptosporidium muris (strain RN66) TaxID=441375 RepID=B6AAZ2_CRYMR|nr:zinc finger, CCCH type domain-containing protein [Cryptosporidium muris RN66]EEA05544.1 zinc finger, CCCH type domain-containing protein [Cryptosporidium muris RN66]|eukprot:XP_002139893.1 zinc finger, CCCH type domain-containing protein [Cryptosporidium muris RN66]
MSNRRPCQFFLRGSCRFGDKCRDYHPKSNLFGDNNGINQSNTNTTPNNPFMSSNSGGNITNKNIFGGNIFNGISPFSNTNSTLTSSPFNNSNTSISTNKTSTLNIYIQTLELIGIVIKSGVWPFGPIGLLGQELVFKSMSLNFEEFRWIFYQIPSSDWPSLYMESLKNLQKLYTDFIEEGRKINKLPLQHQLYSLDLGSFSQIGNLFSNKSNITDNSNNASLFLGSNSYIFGHSSNNTNIVTNNNPFTSSTKFGLSSNDSNNINQQFKSPFTTSSATNFTSPFNSSINNTNNILTNPNINTSQSNNTQLQVSSNNNNIFSNNGMNNNTNIFGNTLNLQTGLNFVSNSPFNNNSTSINNPFSSSIPVLSFNNNKNHQENIDIEYGQVQLEEWEEQAFKNDAFEKGKIPEKVPPKNFCI